MMPLDNFYGVGPFEIPLVKAPGFGIKIEPVLEDPEHKAARLEAEEAARALLIEHIGWFRDRVQASRDLLLKIAVAAKTEGRYEDSVYLVPFDTELLRELADEVNAPGPNGEKAWR